MKKKRKLIKERLLAIVFLIVFVGTLFANIIAIAESLPLEIDSIKITDKSDDVTGDILGSSKDEATNNITFHKLYGFVKYDINIKSNMDKDVTILSITDDNNNEYIAYEYDKHENYNLKANGSFDLAVKAVYKNELNDLSKREQASKVTFKIKYLDDTKEKEKEIVINPKTGDRIGIYFVLLVVSGIGFITCILIDRDRDKRKISKVSMLIISGLVLTPVIVRATLYSFNILLKSDIELLDKMIVTVTINGKEKEIINSYGERISGLETPTETGYTFDKWVYEDGSDFDPSKPITEDTKLVARLVADEYTISYDLNGGNVATNNPTTYKITDKIELVEPTKEHYVFLGWTGTDLAEPTKNLVIENKTGNRTYVANYSPKEYSITYEGLLPEEISSLNNPTSYNIESSSFTLVVPADRVDSDGDKTELFAGWKENSTISSTITLPNLSSMGDKVFEAQWIPASSTIYSITYNLNGGTTETANPVEFTKNTETFTLVNPTKEGYTFKGWSGTDLTGDENTLVKVVKGTRNNLVFEAHYTANKYQVIFNKNGSNVSGTMDNQEFTYGVAANLNDIAYLKEGYTFTSWNTAADGSGTAYNNKEQVESLVSTQNGELNLYAQWSPNTYKIRFNANENTAEGTMVDLDMVYDTAKTLPLNVYSVQGYTFDSWNTKADGTGTKITNGEEVNNLTTDGIVDLYAKWVPKTDTSYKVEYYQENAEDSNYSIYETEYESGTTDTIANAVIKNYTYYTYDSNNAQNVVSGNIERDGSLVLKVYYKRVVHTVEFDTNGGSAVNNIEKKHGAKLLFAELPSTAKTPAEFLGWYTEKDAGELIENDMVINDDTILYAHWTIPALCRRATKLHTDTCARTDNGGCNKAGYSDNGSYGTKTIVYGNTSGETLTSGDAFDCDVNGDGVYDADNERFYYIRTNDDKAVMIFYSNYEGEDGVQTISNYEYDEVIDKLPTTEQWTNVATTYDTKAARLLQVDDVVVACGVQPGSTTIMKNCDYILENTSFKVVNTSITRTGIWVEKSGDNYYRIQSTALQFPSVASTSKNVARPVIDVPLSLIDNSPITEYTVSFDSLNGVFAGNGTNSILNQQVNDGGVIRILPIPTKDNATFVGWYTDTSYTEKVVQPLEVNSNKTYYAKWSYDNSVAVTNNLGYDTLQDAVNAVSTTATEPTVVQLLANTEEKITISGGRKVKIDLNNNTVSNVAGNNTVVVDNGTLEIYNGTLVSTDDSNAVVNVNSNGTLTTTNLIINANGDRQAIYNDGGETYIMDGSNFTGNATERAVVQNKSNGTVVITGGTITSNELYGIYNENGTLIIGNKDSVINTNKPVIQGKTFGIVANSTYNFYDGIVKGETAPVGKTANTGNTPTISVDTGETKISEIEVGSEKINEQETDSLYKVLYLELEGSKYIITLDPGNGTVSPSTIVVNAGNSIDYLPTPTNGQYTFDGWFDLDTDLPVDTSVVPDGNKTYYAKWSFTPQHTEFSILNDAMKQYYNNISSWKDNQLTFQINMDNNFNAYNCQPCDATASNPYQTCPIYNENGKKQCDRPQGFNTGVSGNVNVYLSNESTKEKGSLVNYVTVTGGMIYNMIPGETYYWESAEDTNIYGTVKALGERRIVDAGAVRNVRDLGGLEVDSDGDGTVDGKLKYGRAFRGVRLATSSDILSLEKLGITEEIDLRGSQTDPQLSNYVPLAITNYEIDKENYSSNYTALRNALTKAMDDVINGQNIFFHCKIGTDRTGTFAYFLEGLLGVSEEDRLQDYELSYFYGVLNRHRFYSYQPGSSITHRFVYMHDLYPTNEDIYNYYMSGSTDATRDADAQRVIDFRNAMINYY